MVNMSPLGQYSFDGSVRCSYLIYSVLQPMEHMILFGYKANYISLYQINDKSVFSSLLYDRRETTCGNSSFQFLSCI